MSIEVGQPAPPFKLRNKAREEVTNESFPGKNIVLAFYPLAFTGGCTNEMQAFRDQNYLFEEANAQVLGVSCDSWASAGEFEEKLVTGFPLVSDFPKNQAGRDYGTFNEQFGTNSRTTVVIDAQGIVRGVYSEGRDFASHPGKALEILAEVNGTSQG